MTTLYTRAGREQAAHGHTDKGRPFYRRQERCHRCGGAGGAECWRHTGWTCYECGGSGQGPVRTDPLYTREQLDKLDAAQAKRQAKKQAERDEAQRQATARADAWKAEHADFVADLRACAALYASGQSFFDSLLNSLECRGQLTERQVEAGRESVAREKAKQEAAKHARHVGTVGERRQFRVTVKRVLDITPEPRPYGYGRRYLLTGIDADGQAIVYKGSAPFGNEGDTVDIVATVDEHGDYKGTPQTRVSRPRVINATEEAA